MMWRCKFIFAFTLLVVTIGAQTPPPPPPPPPPAEIPSPLTEEEMFERRLKWLNSTVLSIDELLNPLAYYKSQDDIYDETPDSVRAANKLSKCYFRGEPGKGFQPPPVLNYTWYDQAGKVQQTAAAITATGDSVVHRWKYNTKGLLTLYCSLEFEKNGKGKWRISGDSVLFKYDSFDNMIEESRFAVIRESGTKSDYLVSKTTFRYDAGGRVISKVSGTVVMEYSYDAKGRPVLIKHLAPNKKAGYIDSLSWMEGPLADTIDHWAILVDSDLTVNVDMLIVNRTTGNELRYLLFLPEKYNFIRKVTGPLDVRMEYDAGNRLIKKGIYNAGDTLLAEGVYTYNDKGILTQYSTAEVYDPSVKGPPPPMAYGHNNLYISTVFTYTVPLEGTLPTRVTIEEVLFDLKPDTRVRIADRQADGAIVIIQERR